MNRSTNKTLSAVILQILQKGEFTTGEIQERIRYRYNDIYRKIESSTDAKGKKSPFNKSVDGALQSLKRQKLIEKSSPVHGSPWKLL